MVGENPARVGRVIRQADGRQRLARDLHVHRAGKFHAVGLGIVRGPGLLRPVETLVTRLGGEFHPQFQADRPRLQNRLRNRKAIFQSSRAVAEEFPRAH